MNVEIVIGANYGDEGKGLVSNYLSKHRKNPIVVLANGGSQRGHSVDNPSGKRFVFHHFGAGTASGAPTFFAKTFLLNPMQFVREYDELAIDGNAPVSFRDVDCQMQLPGDIALNWHLETERGENRHGSVGCGIWESVFRIRSGKGIRLDEFVSMPYDRQASLIKESLYEFRNLRCGIEGIRRNSDIFDIFMDPGFINHFIADARFMAEKCAVSDFHMICSLYDTLIFENGQGLMLDQEYGKANVKNTTPSYTGSIGIAALLSESGIIPVSITANYVSRTYLTRHGAGDLPGEDGSITFGDMTNGTNKWQGKLRFAELDYRAMLYRISEDFRILKSKMTNLCGNVSKHLIMTHANEISPDMNFVKAGDFISDTKYDISPVI